MVPCCGLIVSFQSDTLHRSNNMFPMKQGWERSCTTSKCTRRFVETLPFLSRIVRLLTRIDVVFAVGGLAGEDTNLLNPLRQASHNVAHIVLNDVISILLPYYDGESNLQTKSTRYAFSALMLYHYGAFC